MTDDDRRLERTTLNLVNMVAYSSSSREHAREFLRATGVALAPSDIRLIEYLSGRGEVPTSVVAADLRIDLSQASRQSRQLAEAGFVARTQDADDRRRTLLSLTPAADDLLDRWLETWSADYRAAAHGWAEDEMVALDDWFARVLRTFMQALPDRPSLTVPDHWLSLTTASDLSPAERSLTATTIGLVAWVGHSSGFEALLDLYDVPIGQQTFFTLRTIAREGPLSVAEVAELLGVDRSQASKRLTQLTELDLVDRAVDSFDRRSSLVRISRRGRALDEQIRQAQVDEFIQVLGEVAPADRERWTVLTTRYVDALLAPSLI